MIISKKKKIQLIKNESYEMRENNLNIYWSELAIAWNFI